MKINKIIYLILASFLLVFTACEPIVDESSLSDSTDVAGVELVAKQSTPGGNKVTISMVTPGITGYWDFNLGTALTNETTIVYPIPGKSTFTYVGTLGSQFFTKTIDVQIDQLDTRLDQDWYDLVSENTTAGKTWVFDLMAADNKFWFMSPNDSPDSAMSVWWNAGVDAPPSDKNGKIHFDLDGAANYNHYEEPGSAPTKGSFVLDISNKKLIIKGSKILGHQAETPDNTYTIITLTEDKLVLYVPSKGKMNVGTGWTFVYKAQ
nr:hypothetical protein [uncultured Flavobacterium sp.]